MILIEYHFVKGVFRMTPEEPSVRDVPLPEGLRIVVTPAGPRCRQELTEYGLN